MQTMVNLGSYGKLKWNFKTLQMLFLYLSFTIEVNKNYIQTPLEIIIVQTMRQKNKLKLYKGHLTLNSYINIILI